MLFVPSARHIPEGMLLAVVPKIKSRYFRKCQVNFFTAPNFLIVNLYIDHLEFAPLFDFIINDVYLHHNGGDFQLSPTLMELNQDLFSLDTWPSSQLKLIFPPWRKSR